MTRHFKSDCATSKHHPIICACKHKPWWLSRKMVHEQASETHAVLFSCSRSLYVEHGYTVTALTFMWGWHSLSRNLIFDRALQTSWARLVYYCAYLSYPCARFCAWSIWSTQHVKHETQSNSRSLRSENFVLGSNPIHWNVENIQRSMLKSIWVPIMHFTGYLRTYEVVQRHDQSLMHKFVAMNPERC